MVAMVCTNIKNGLLQLSSAGFSRQNVLTIAPQGLFFRRFAMYPCNHQTCPVLEIELIRLTQGKYAIVDKEDFSELSKHKWYADFVRNNFVAKRDIRKGPTCYSILMHQQIMNTFGKGRNVCVDHKNHIRHDNRKTNLRACSLVQNRHNSFPNKNKLRTKYKGVGLQNITKNKTWQARITVKKKTISLGYFKEEKDAAIAYNNAAKKYFGEFAYLNEV